MTTFKAAVIILIALCIIGEIIIGWWIAQIGENVDVMRHEYLKLMKEMHETAKRMDAGWVDALKGWEETCLINRQLLELLTHEEEGGQE